MTATTDNSAAAVTHRGDSVNPGAVNPGAAPDARSEAQLLSAARRGDPTAVSALYDGHADAHYRLACCTLGASATAEDVVVDVLVEACTPTGLEAADASSRQDPPRLRAELARRTYQRCVDHLPPAHDPAPAALGLCLYTGCSRREVALILGRLPAAGVPALLRRHLHEVGWSLQTTADPAERSRGLVKPRG